MPGEWRSAERRRERAALMGRAQQGDQEAYRTLLDDLVPMLRAFLRRRVFNVNEVDDIVQDVLLAMHRARHTYDPARPIEPWIFAIARNVAIDHTRRHLARSGWETTVEELPDTPGEIDAPLAPRLDEALEKLPAAQREAFRMLKLEGLSVDAAAERAGTTPGALKVRAHRAYKALRILLGAGDE